MFNDLGANWDPTDNKFNSVNSYRQDLLPTHKAFPAVGTLACGRDHVDTWALSPSIGRKAKGFPFALHQLAEQHAQRQSLQQQKLCIGRRSCCPSCM